MGESALHKRHTAVAYLAGAQANRNMKDKNCQTLQTGSLIFKNFNLQLLAGNQKEKQKAFRATATDFVVARLPENGKWSHMLAFCFWQGWVPLKVRLVRGYKRYRALRYTIAILILKNAWPNIKDTRASGLNSISSSKLKGKHWKTNQKTRFYYYAHKFRTSRDWDANKNHRKTFFIKANLSKRKHP